MEAGTLIGLLLVLLSATSFISGFVARGVYDRYLAERLRSACGPGMIFE